MRHPPSATRQGSTATETGKTDLETLGDALTSTLADAKQARLCAISYRLLILSRKSG